MPWGHVAIKRWGNPQGQPLLGVHGWLDNACTFDGLAPLLPLNDFNFVVIDLPGHGWSSRYPDGMSYKASDALVVFRRLQLHFGWDKCHVIGHSMGAGLAAMFASIFPQHVERLVLLDLLMVGPTKVSKTARSTAQALKENIKVMDKMASSPEPLNTYEDCVARAFMANQLIHGLDSISRSSVETLMERGLRKVKTDEKTGQDLYTWTADFRLRIPSPFKVGLEQVEHFAEQIVCPLLILKSTDAPFYMSDADAERILHVYKTHNPHFQYHRIAGGHHFHLNEPSKVAPHVNKFLKATFSDESPEDKHKLPFDLI